MNKRPCLSNLSAHLPAQPTVRGLSTCGPGGSGLNVVAVLGRVSRRVAIAYDVVNASYLPTTINIYDLEIRLINNYRKSYNMASFLVSTTISRRCRFGNSKPCKFIRSSYVRRNCINDNNRVSANISSYDYR